ncbi:MAG: tRNA uridine 5-carboxymethylaminomethyl modification enzyme MnmG [Acidobacteria bacterium ADurb.Bin340]|nr:MAG: tRNA uridine 5-carboxymethylaminomethyl modification enzyme MnmG [Acidobacteria bacterium ADurb.Bin340]
MRVVVIGGGHAGIEAAHAAARLGAEATLVTLNLDQIGQMSCNPSIGGVGKGHMVREIDALGGLMGRLTDAAGIHFRTLNASRGFAVRGPRAQADRVRYRLEARQALERTPGLRLQQGMVAALGWEAGTRGLRGVELTDGSFIPCEAVVVTSGTFLNGRVLTGARSQSAGRAGEPASTDLAEQLRALGLPWRRLKTGTSPRIARGTIDFSRLELQPGDVPLPRFSFFGSPSALPQVPCHIATTTEATEAVVRRNLERSALYGGHIEGLGPRYCPSIEDKFVKFPDKGRHQIFVEPDSLETAEVYLAGLATSMPLDVQIEMVQSLPGFEQAEILRPGYAIEYDAFDPLMLDRGLGVRDLDGIWFAGQVNGTTGYEEAAGQGFLAGVNAVRWLQGREPLVLGRHQAYLGVMVDDLVTKGTDEPYRMLTARAEHRLSLACDLADVRLLEVAEEAGVLGLAERARVRSRQVRRERLHAACGAAWVTPGNELGTIVKAAGHPLSGGLSLMELLQRPQLASETVDALLAQLPLGSMPVGEDWDAHWEREVLRFEAQCAPYRAREARMLETQRAWDHVRIPEDFPMATVEGFSHEVREKLLRHRPETLGQASRIPGITPAAVTLLHLLIERKSR